MNLREVGRAMGLGVVATKLYREPKKSLVQSIREGGPLQQRRTISGRLEMEKAAEAIMPELRNPNTDNLGLPIYFMTGRKYWYQTVFCFCSLLLTSGRSYQPILIDDGSIDSEIEQKLRRVVPWVEIRCADEIKATISKVLPLERYPNIHFWRQKQPLTRKVIDLHAGQSGWKILLDSDMLFFRKPEWLHDWYDRDPLPAYMIDCDEAYGYSAALRTRVGGSSDFPDRANIGFFGWKSEDVDFDWLEYALETLIAEEGPRYNLTQGLTSMMFAGRRCAIAPENDYIVKPSLSEGMNPTAILHHYVAESKRPYFQKSHGGEF